MVSSRVLVGLVPPAAAAAAAAAAAIRVQKEQPPNELEKRLVAKRVAHPLADNMSHCTVVKKRERGRGRAKMVREKAGGAFPNPPGAYPR